MALRSAPGRAVSPDEVPNDFLLGSAAEYAAPFVRQLSDAMMPMPDTRIGAWRLVRELGRGGMGTVYLAERVDAGFTQRVALKVVRGTFTLDDHLIARFRDERQILAALDHPGIARLVDGGVTPDGLPWYAMEHVDGVSITAYAHDARFTTRERLRLFLEVCDAVAHAHQRLVVHRDLKPSNLLVSADGRPRLVDFGVARLLTDTEAPFAEQPRATRAYASPEQLRGEAISATDDVHSLGVILLELLRGTRPGPDDRSGVDALDPDLRAIAGRAAAPNAAARYPSVGALADDINRHLEHHPVLARGDDPLYRTRRFMARHRLGVLGTLAVAGSLIGGLSLALVHAQRADRERDAAQVAATTATEVSEFLTRLLSLADPNTTIGATITVAETIDSAAAWLDRDLAGAPAAHADLALVLADLYGATGQVTMHQRMADSALVLHERLWGPDDPRLARTLGAVVESRWASGGLADSEAMLRRMIALAARDTASQPFTSVHARNLLAISLRDQGRLREAEAVLQSVVAEREELARIYPVGLDYALTGLGHVALADDRPGEAAEYYGEVLARRRQSLGATHPEVANALINLARAEGNRGAFDASLAHFAEGLAMRRATQGEEHSEIGVDLVGLGDVQWMSGDTAAARATYRDALERLTRSHGEDHPLAREVAAKLYRP